MTFKFNINDAIVSPFFVLSAGVAGGLFSLTLFGIDFASTVLTLGSGAAAIKISIAKVISVIALAVAFATNRPDLSKMGMVETWVAIATLGLTLAPPFSPVFQGWLQTTTIAGLIALFIQSAGFYTLAYLGGEEA